MAIPWLMVSVGAALLLVGAFVLAYKKKGLFKPWTYENWLEAGGIFLIIGYVMCRFGRDSEVLGFIGIIYILIGLLGKYLLKGKKYTDKQRNFIAAGMALFLIAGLVVFMLVN